VGPNTGLTVELKIDSFSALSLGYTNKSGEGESYYTYDATYQLQNADGTTGDDATEDGVKIRSLASLSSNYSDYYSTGLSDAYDNLETQMVSFNSAAAKYEELISSGVDPNSAEAVSALNYVKKIYSYMSDTSDYIDTLVDEVKYSTHDLDDTDVDISSAVSEANSSVKNFMETLSQRLNTLADTGKDSDKDTSTTSLDNLKDKLKNTLIPAAEDYYENVADGKGVYASQQGCQAALVVCDSAISRIAEMRAVLGAAQNRIDYTLSSLQTTSDNMEDSLSRVKDADMAEEMTEYSKYNVIVQAGISMLAQANQRPNQLLSLLQ
jgi:flagellin-like hook-associated protein FlgL